MKIKFGIILFLFITCARVAAQEPVIKTVKELVNGSKTFDGQSVVIRGEAIGQVMSRGDFAWVNVEDATGQIGVWLSLEEAGKIGSLGNYHTKGDIVQVEGIFARADTRLQGETAVRAQTVTIIFRGEPIPHEFNMVKVEISAALLACALCLWGSREMIKRRRRAGK